MKLCTKRVNSAVNPNFFYFSNIFLFRDYTTMFIYLKYITINLFQTQCIKSR